MADGSLSIDFTNCFSDSIGPLGLDHDALDAVRPVLAEVIRALNAGRSEGSERWRTLPDEPDRGRLVTEARELAERLGPTTDDLVLLGIGGSTLGTSAVHRALRTTRLVRELRDGRTSPRFFVIDNVDPAGMSETLHALDIRRKKLERVTFIVVSRSGETIETVAQFAIIRELLRQTREDAAGRQVVAITGPDGGTIGALADTVGAHRCTIPDGVGGRFSVLSPVGLVPLTICGIDPDPLLAGAAAMDERCRHEDVDTNPAAMLAWVLVEHARRGRPNDVLMPYADALTGLVQWWRQLWAESLGKRFDLDGREAHAGLTPIAALGATDQHSQIQLYREGPPDKVVGIVAVTNGELNMRIPEDLGGGLDWLGGTSLGTILAAERDATVFALRESGRPSYTITLPAITPRSVGEFLQLWMVATACAARLLNVDAYDQPAVETGKREALRLLGRPEKGAH